MPQTIRLRRDFADRWEEVNPILSLGEPGFERDTGRMKVGDGVSRWVALEYINIGTSDEPPAPGDGVPLGDLNGHVHAPTPHPIYDDGPSLILLYLNAKV